MIWADDLARVSASTGLLNSGGVRECFDVVAHSSRSGVGRTHARSLGELPAATHRGSRPRAVRVTSRSNVSHPKFPTT